jgi:hypothetical protein
MIAWILGKYTRGKRYKESLRDDCLDPPFRSLRGPPGLR